MPISKLLDIIDSGWCVMLFREGGVYTAVGRRGNPSREETAKGACPEESIRALWWEIRRTAIREAAGEFNAERFEAITGRSLSGEQAEEGSATAGQTDAT
jgi:hypothetical protein